MKDHFGHLKEVPKLPKQKVADMAVKKVPPSSSPDAEMSTPAEPLAINTTLPPSNATPSKDLTSPPTNGSHNLVTPTSNSTSKDIAVLLSTSSPAKPSSLKPTPANNSFSNKPSVGFSAANTVVKAATDQEDPAAVQICPQLALVFFKTSKCKTTLFVKICLPIKTKLKDPTATTCLKLKELGELMVDQDPSTLIYKYKQMAKDKNDACTKLSQLPTTITGVQSYMNGFCPSTKGGDLLGNLCIGIDSNAEDFLSNISQEAFMCKFWIRKAPLQVADSEYAGWLYLSTEALDPKEATQSANLFIKNNCEKSGQTPFNDKKERRRAQGL